LGICAAIHGNERTGTEIVLETARRYADGTFRGRLLLLPVANPLAFEANRRHTPTDDLNLNRLFPGRIDGWFSEQLAEIITRTFLTKMGSSTFIPEATGQPSTTCTYGNAEALSRAFGSRVLYRSQPGKEARSSKAPRSVSPKSEASRPLP
jgi:hypothetical protein